jgi:hypothetical protein
MTYEDGTIVGENAVDAVAVAEERFPDCTLIAVQTTLVIKYKGKTRVLNVIKERS